MSERKSVPTPARLGVNVDHVATVRQARGVSYPDPVAAAAVAEMAGASQITVHLRLDRRHVQVRDLEILARTIQTRLNVEVAPEEEALAIMLQIRPHTVTLVPERSGEVTTEGGLDLEAPGAHALVFAAVQLLQAAGIVVSIFVDPDLSQVAAVKRAGARSIELNTAAYSEAKDEAQQCSELDRIERAAVAAGRTGLYVAAGHGLHYHNVGALADLGCIAEFNIGHAIIARAMFSGLDAAVRDMLDLIS